MLPTKLDQLIGGEDDAGTQGDGADEVDDDWPVHVRDSIRSLRLVRVRAIDLGRQGGNERMVARFVNFTTADRRVLIP